VQAHASVRQAHEKRHRRIIIKTGVMVRVLFGNRERAGRSFVAGTTARNIAPSQEHLAVKGVKALIGERHNDPVNGGSGRDIVRNEPFEFRVIDPGRADLGATMFGTGIRKYVRVNMEAQKREEN